MKKKIIAVASVAVVMALCGVLFSSCKKAAVEDAYIPTSTPLAQGDIANTITTMCTVASASTMNVSTSVDAPVKEILVNVGDNVTKNQLLCRLDDSSLQTDYALKQKAYARAKQDYNDSVAQATTALSRLQEDYNKVYDAQNTALAKLNAEKERLATADANESLAAQYAQVNDYSKYVDTWNGYYTTVTSGKTLYTSLPIANLMPYDTLTEVAAPDAVPAGYNVVDLAMVSCVMQKAQTELNRLRAEADKNFKAAYDICYTRVESEHSSEITPLKQDYEAAVKSSGEAAVLAQRGIDDAKTALEKTKKDTTSVDSANRDMEEALKKLDQCEVTAPIAGTVISSKAAINGTPVSADALFSIANNTDFQVTGLVNEYDSTRIVTGMECQITTNATGDTVMAGVLTAISPQATDASGNFTVTASITNPDPAVRSGMTGKLKIVLDGAKNCFYVATDSIGTDSNGNSVVYVVPDTATDASSTASSGADITSQAKAIVVEQGVSTDYYTQITGSGLEAGMNILDTPL